MKQIRVLIADDHNILRQGLADIFRNSRIISVIAEAENGHKLYDSYELLKPDVVLTDIEMPVMNGLKAAKKIIQSYPDAKILFLSMYSSEELIYKIESLSGKGLLPKTIDNKELIKAVKVVAAGGKYYFGKSEKEINALKKRFDLILAKEDDAASFTARQKNILLLIAEGRTSEEIADKLLISKKTIDADRSKLMDKLNLTSVAQLMKYALEYTQKTRGANFSE